MTSYFFQWIYPNTVRILTSMCNVHLTRICKHPFVYRRQYFPYTYSDLSGTKKDLHVFFYNFDVTCGHRMNTFLNQGLLSAFSQDLDKYIIATGQSADKTMVTLTLSSNSLDDSCS